MLDFIVSPPEVYGASGKYPVRASIPDEAAHAFFFRYFADAQIDRSKHNYLGFWGGTVVSGYGLVRLRQVLEDSLSDLANRPSRFRVLCGWKTMEIGEETERWEEVDRDALMEIAREIITAVDLARSTTNHRLALGD